MNTVPVPIRTTQTRYQALLMVEHRRRRTRALAMLMDAGCYLERELAQPMRYDAKALRMALVLLAQHALVLREEIQGVPHGN